MKKGGVVCVFAHPDDEAFGPSGTIAHFAKDREVYILCATAGEEAGKATIRKKELLASAKILDVKQVYFLGFIDGELSNNKYHHLADKIQKIINGIKPEILLTFEPRGISGHIDHIVVSMVSSYLFERHTYIKKIMYHCLDEKRRKTVGSYFVYFPPGYKRSEIDEIIDVSSYWDKKIAAIKCHKSQINDMKRILKRYDQTPKLEFFLTRTKPL